MRRLRSRVTEDYDLIWEDKNGNPIPFEVVNAKFKRAYLRERAKIDKQIDKFTKDQSARKEILQTGKK